MKPASRASATRRGKMKSDTLPVLPRTVAVPRITLSVEAESGKVAAREAIVDGDTCRIGSHASNELCLDDPLASNFHCSLKRTPNGWRVTDTGSLNGTMVNGVRVRDADLPADECVLTIGQSRVRISESASGTEVEVPVSPAFGDIVGTSVVMRRLFGVLQRVANSGSNVLIQGESGTGKEAICTEIVRRGARADKPLIIVDCGSISPTIIESELFGHARGAFTGADRERIGAFEEADGGTVVLDEIGELPLPMQPKLLRAIESQEVRRVGENLSRSVDVRVIAATNRKLEREVNHGRFRGDLFFRLSVVTVSVPPLREHLEDIPILVNLFLRFFKATDRKELFTDQVLAEMARYEWPGNVRELRNYVERTVVFDAVVPTETRRSLPPPPPGDTIDLDEPFTSAKKRIIEEFEQDYLMVLLAWSEGNISQAARKAGMDRMYLHRLVQRHGIKRGGSIKD